MSRAVADGVWRTESQPMDRKHSGDVIRLAPVPVPASTRTPVLLVDASWYGTLAAVRDLGSRGVPVIVGYDAASAPTRWSRYVTAAIPCPATSDTDRFLQWLHDFGRRTPGCVLYPTSDDVAFLAAAHRETLEPLFALFSPPLQSLLDMLDKSRLAAAAQRAGLPAAPTWAPNTEAELLELLPTLPMPVIVKPRAQMLASGASKGVKVTRPEDLPQVWRELRDAASPHPQALAASPNIGVPVIQPYFELSETIYTVDGFAAADGTIVGALACNKVLQLPRRAGAGVYFEHAPLDDQLVAGLERLCRDTGFVGVFDIEFALCGDQKLLIDFNPRFYNHMAFEVDRGLPLPWMVYLTATGQEDAVGPESDVARRRAAGARGVYVHALPLRLMLAAQRITGGMTAEECRHWRRLTRRRNVLSDAVYTRRDILPACVDVMHLFRHPRSLIRRAAA